MPPSYLAELAKIHEPPEMASTPMQARKPVSPSVVKLESVINAIGSPEKATHQQRATAIRDLVGIAESHESGLERATVYGATAALACIDGADSQIVIGYANGAIGDDDGSARALRARMYLRSGDRTEALSDLEKVMEESKGHALAGGEANPREKSAPCGWSIADLDALGNDPRALAAKGLYLSSFIGYGAAGRGTVQESTIRDLYARSASSWHSPIPRFLDATTLDGLGGAHSMAGVRCIRAKDRAAVVPEIANACAMYDEGNWQGIRELTMALVIEPTFMPALSARAEKYLQLAQSAYADGKPSAKLFDLAVKDFTTAIAAGSKDPHALYCDRALAFASTGRYQEAAAGYMQGMRYAKNGVESSPFVYEQLANVYMKLGRFDQAADVITQAIIHATGGGMDAVIFGGGITAFRALYPEYDSLPDDILAEAVRRRYQPQFPQSWDVDFTSKNGAFKGKIASTILADLYVMRGDANMKAGHRTLAQADYRRLKSDAWTGEERFLPRHMYFDDRGSRDFDLPAPWPPPPPKM